MSSGFQSSPGPQAGRYIPSRRGIRGDGQVSILARPAGRALQCDLYKGRKSIACFNPRPARRPGATSRRSCRLQSTTLFQSSPGPQAGRYRRTVCVSPGSTLFQSSPGPQAGRYSRHCRCGPGRQCGFNPRPARRPGATWEYWRVRSRSVSFQSSPGPQAGRYAGNKGLAELVDKFQSSPGPQAGRYSTKPPLRGPCARLLSTLRRLSCPTARSSPSGSPVQCH